MKRREIVSDNQGGTVLKTLSSPIRKTVVDKNLRLSDDDDMSRLNDEGGPSEKKGLPTRAEPSERPRKTTVIGNHGPDENGKVDWDKNPDCVDAILQYHEQYRNSDDMEGYTKTAERCYRQFNKLFSASKTPANVSIEDIVEGLENHNSPSMKARPETEESNAETPTQRVAPQKATETFFKIRTKSLPIVADNKVALRGTQFEICKILNCKNICLMQPSKGKAEQNGYFHAACANSDGITINPIGCPQLEDLPEKEHIAFEMFKQQFNGDELQAKKFLFLTRKIYGK